MRVFISFDKNFQIIPQQAYLFAYQGFNPLPSLLDLERFFTIL